MDRPRGFLIVVVNTTSLIHNHEPWIYYKCHRLSFVILAFYGEFDRPKYGTNLGTTIAGRVAVRVRPLTEQEKQTNGGQRIEITPNQPQISVGSNRLFTFDYVYPPSATQEQVYTTCVIPLLSSFVKGYNATILAYGQTGSGKTYSMGIGIDSTINEQHRGIVPRFVYSLFERVESMRSVYHSCQISVSFLELHNEDLVDLLSPVKREGLNLCIREDSHGQISWTGVREEVVTTPKELLSFLNMGSMARKTASTDMNSVSSRSHAIFSVILKQTIVSKDGQSTDETGVKKLVSKFHFVDLAGSERLKRTNAIGDRAKEGISINAGLSALGNVISALGDVSRRASHIPYRDSKLTRLLQDSLGGNSQTLMLACASPSELNTAETLNTLKYANRARNIRNKVVVNQQLEQEEKSLKATVANLKEELKGTNEFLRAVNDEMDALKVENDGLQATIARLQISMAAVEEERNRLKVQLKIQTKTKEQIQTQMQAQIHAQVQAQIQAYTKAQVQSQTQAQVQAQAIVEEQSAEVSVVTGGSSRLVEAYQFRQAKINISNTTAASDGPDDTLSVNSLLEPPSPRPLSRSMFRKRLDKPSTPILKSIRPIKPTRSTKMVKPTKIIRQGLRSPRPPASPLNPSNEVNHTPKSLGLNKASQSIIKPPSVLSTSRVCREDIELLLQESQNTRRSIRQVKVKMREDSEFLKAFKASATYYSFMDGKNSGQEDPLMEIPWDMMSPKYRFLNKERVCLGNIFMSPSRKETIILKLLAKFQENIDITQDIVDLLEKSQCALYERAQPSRKRKPLVPKEPLEIRLNHPTEYESLMREYKKLKETLQSTQLKNTNTVARWKEVSERAVCDTKRLLHKIRQESKELQDQYGEYQQAIRDLEKEQAEMDIEPISTEETLETQLYKTAAILKKALVYSESKRYGNKMDQAFNHISPKNNARGAHFDNVKIQHGRIPRSRALIHR